MLTHALVLVGLAFLAFLTMTLVWRASVKLRNAGIVDIAWSGLFSLRVGHSDLSVNRCRIETLRWAFEAAGGSS